MKTVIRLFLIFALLMAAILLAASPVQAQTVDPGQGPLPPVQFTPEFLATVAGAVLSLAFSYIPTLNTKFAQLSSEAKRLIMAALLLLITSAIYGLGCAGVLSIGLACDQNGLTRAIYIFLLALMANQSTFTISPPADAVKALKAG
jgi:hypothetical protein